MTRLTNQQLGDRFGELSKAKITNAWVRHVTENAETGHRTLLFKGPDISRKPARLKWNFDAVRYRLETQLRRFEKALNFRESLVAELALRKPNFERAQELIEALVRQGVDLTPENWAMDCSDKVDIAAMQKRMAERALKNLETMIEKLPVARTPKEVAVDAALQSLKKGLEKSIQPGTPLALASKSSAADAARGPRAKPGLEVVAQLHANREKAVHDLMEQGKRPISDDGSEGSHLSV